MAEYLVKAGQKAPTFCEMDEACEGDDMFIMQRGAQAILVGKACRRAIEWCPVRNGSTALRVREYGPALQPQEILPPQVQPPIDDAQAEFLDKMIAENARRNKLGGPANGGGWLEAGTPMQAPDAADNAYHSLPVTVPQRRAGLEYTEWLRNGRQLADIVVDRDALPPTNPSHIDPAKDVAEGRYL